MQCGLSIGKKVGYTYILVTTAISSCYPATCVEWVKDHVQHNRCEFNDVTVDSVGSMETVGKEGRKWGT